MLAQPSSKALLTIFFIALLALTICGQTLQQTEVRELLPLQTIEREMTGAETHSYKINLQKDEFFQVRVEQKGVDVALKLIDASGTVLATMDSPNSKEGPETLSFVATKAGSYILEVSGFDPKAEKGNYNIRREASRAATTKDRRRVEIERLFVEGMKARDTEGQAETAIKKLAEAQAGWQELRDDYLAELTGQQVQQIKEARNQPDVRQLAIGETVKRQLKSGESHVYFVELKQGQVLRIDAQEKGIDLKILFALVGDKQHIMGVDFGGGYGRETLTVEVEKAGTYGVFVGSPGSPLSGSYELTANIKEAASETDRERVEAERLLQEGAANKKGEELYKAIPTLEKALNLWNKLGEKYWEAYTLYIIGVAQMDSGRSMEAIETLNRVLPLWQAADAKHDEAKTQQRLSLLYLMGDKYKQSEAALKAALALMIEVSDHKSQTQILMALSTLYEASSERLKAEVYNLVASVIHDTGIETGMMLEIGSVQREFGNFSFAIEAYQLGLIYAKARKDKSAEAYFHMLLADVDLQLKRYQDAKAELNLALQLFQELPGHGGTAETLGFLSEVSRATGEKTKAVEYADKALAAPGAYSQTNTLIYAGKAYLTTGDPNRALLLFNKALLLAKKFGNFSGEADALINLMLAWQALGNTRLAVYYGKQAVNRVQAERTFFKTIDQLGTSWTFNQSGQQAFLKAYEPIYKQLAGLLIENNRLAEAQEVLFFLKDQQLIDFDKSEATEDRNLLPQLVRGETSALDSNRDIESRGISYTPREAAAAKSYAGTGGRLADLSLELRTGGKALSELDAAATKRLDEATAKFADVLKQTDADFSQPPSDKDNPTAPSTLRELQSTLRELNQQTGQKAVAIYTLVGEENLHVLLVTQDGIESHISSVKAEALNEKVLQFYGLLQSPAYDPRELGKQLYDIILKPLETKLKRTGAQILVWSLDDSLRYVPMAALSPDGKSYLIEQYQNIILTRATRERLLRPVSAKWTGTGFGSSQEQKLKFFDSEITFPKLPGVLLELQAIFGTGSNSKSIVPGTFFTDDRFTKSAFYEAMKARRTLVHISSHFAFRPGNIRRSFLVLGDSSALTLSELKQQERLFDGVELLTLSACNTAATQPDANGNEIDGFAELAQRLGASAVMATLWQVSDCSTPWLMKDFYAAKLNKSSTTKTEALRTAQLALLKGTNASKCDYEVGKGSGISNVKVVVTPDASKQTRDLTRGDVVYISEKDAPLFKHDDKKPFAHPYYWSPFVLYGNWR